MPRDKRKGSWSGLGSSFLELVGREFDAITFDSILDVVGPELDGCLLYPIVTVCVIPDTGFGG